MYFNFNTNCTDNSNSETNFRIGTCSICFNEVDLNVDRRSCHPHKLYETCSKYLHPAITKNVTLGNTDVEVSNFCTLCLESADQLADLTDKLEVFQKNVSEYVLMFSLEIFQRRADPYKNRGSIDLYDKKLVLCNLSGLQEHKSAQSAASFQSPLISIETESSNLGQTVRDPLITSEEGPTADNILNSVIFERIIKTENFENEDHGDGKQGFGKIGVTILTGSAVSLKENVPKSQSSRSKKPIILANPDPKINPFVKLNQLTSADLKDVIIPIEIPPETRNSNVLITNTFNINSGVEFKAFSAIDPALTNISDEHLPAENGSGFRYRCRQKSETEVDPDFYPITTNISAKKTDNGYECSVCQKVFPFKPNLVSHFRIHTGEMPFKCSRCKKAFRHKCNMEVHKRKCGAGTIRKYNRSSAPVKFESGVAREIQGDGGTASFECSVCHKDFTTKASLVSHFRRHTGEKPFNCSKCNKPFRHQSGMYSHRKICGYPRKYDPTFDSMANILITEDGKKLFECSVCHKEFTIKHSLVSHFRVHTGEKPFNCPRCNKSFRHQGNMNVHKRTCGIVFKRKVRPSGTVDPLIFESMTNSDITDERNKIFGCSVCSKVFSIKRSLISHFRLHTGEKPFKCSICLKSFRHESNYGVHLKSHAKKSIKVKNSYSIPEHELPSFEAQDIELPEVEIEYPGVDPLMCVETFTNDNDNIQIETAEDQMYL